MVKKDRFSGAQTATDVFAAVLATVCLAALAVVVIAPHMAAAGGGSDGARDSPAVATVYEAAGLLCHQMPERSYALAGIPMPLCERCFGILLGMTALAGAALVVRPRRGFFAYAGGFLPKTRNPRLLVIATGICLGLPMVIDGTMQLATPYESTALIRIVTGFLYGIGQAGFLLAFVAGADARIDGWRNPEKEGWL
ncbi:MAG: hypothetical protein APR53_07860 [Methanoculleus sp. SDB]|nr:MAG: hypothetical protein APR53_07860 [Methanoculleus sp. SDB]